MTLLSGCLTYLGFATKGGTWNIRLMDDGQTRDELSQLLVKSLAD